MRWLTLPPRFMLSITWYTLCVGASSVKGRLRGQPGGCQAGWIYVLLGIRVERKADVGVLIACCAVVERLLWEPGL